MPRYHLDSNNSTTENSALLANTFSPGEESCLDYSGVNHPGVFHAMDSLRNQELGTLLSNFSGTADNTIHLDPDAAISSESEDSFSLQWCDDFHVFMDREVISTPEPVSMWSSYDRNGNIIEGMSSILNSMMRQEREVSPDYEFVYSGEFRNAGDYLEENENSHEDSYSMLNFRVRVEHELPSVTGNYSMNEEEVVRGGSAGRDLNSFFMGSYGSDQVVFL